MSLVQLPTTGALGVIRTMDGQSYQITPDDVLWLARSVQYEGGNHDATMWTYAWRLMLKAGGRTSLATLVRGHSQPINPLWDEATDPNCVRYPERCTAAHLARRREAANKSWGELPAARRVLEWAQAKVSNPAPRATDFADAQVSRHFLSQHPDARVVMQSGNWYIAEAVALSKPDDYITIEYQGRVAGPGTSFGVKVLAGAFGILASLGGVALWMKAGEW
jgi:hypothetical protein